MQITQTFTMTRTEVAAFREQSSQAIDLLKPLAAELMGEQKVEAQAAKLLKQLETAIAIDVKVANKLSTVGYLLRIKDDVEVVLTINIDDEVFTELMAFGVDLLKDYMGILKAVITLVVNLKELQADSELRSTRRLVALKERMGADKTSVEVNGDEMVNEFKESRDETISSMYEEKPSIKDTEYYRLRNKIEYPVWTIKTIESTSDLMAIGSDSGIDDIKATLVDLSLKHPDETLMLTAFTCTRISMLNGKVVREWKWRDFFKGDGDNVVLTEKIFDDLIPANYNGMGEFKTR